MTNSRMKPHTQLSWALILDFFKVRFVVSEPKLLMCGLVHLKKYLSDSSFLSIEYDDRVNFYRWTFQCFFHFSALLG